MSGTNGFLTPNYSSLLNILYTIANPDQLHGKTIMYINPSKASIESFSLTEELLSFNISRIYLRSISISLLISPMSKTDTPHGQYSIGPDDT